MTPISMDSRVTKLDEYLKSKGKAGVSAFLQNMILKAEHNEAYESEVREWLNSKCTLQLRDLAKPFGDYWAGVEFQNTVDVLDSAIAKI